MGTHGSQKSNGGKLVKNVRVKVKGLKREKKRASSDGKQRRGTSKQPKGSVKKLATRVIKRRVSSMSFKSNVGKASKSHWHKQSEPRLVIKRWLRGPNGRLSSQ